MPSEIFGEDFAYEVPNGKRLVCTFLVDIKNLRISSQKMQTFLQDFGPKGEGADMVYHIPSTFDKAAGKNSNRKSASFGSSDRFQSPGSYLKINNNATGPGHYSTGNFSRPSSRYGTIGPSSPTKDGRLNFRQGEGADAAYNVRSSFDFNQVKYRATPAILVHVL